MFTLESKH